MSLPRVQLLQSRKYCIYLFALGQRSDFEVLRVDVEEGQLLEEAFLEMVTPLPRYPFAFLNLDLLQDDVRPVELLLDDLQRGHRHTVRAVDEGTHRRQDGHRAFAINTPLPYCCYPRSSLSSCCCSAPSPA